MRGADLRLREGQLVQYGYSPVEIELSGLRAHLEGYIFSRLKKPTSVQYRRKAVRFTVEYAVEGLAWPVPDMRSEQNQAVACEQRVRACHPAPDGALARRFIKFAKSDIVKRFKQLPANHDLTVETWLEQGKLKWTTDKYRKFSEEYEKYTDWYDMVLGRGDMVMKMNLVKAFLKDESYQKFKPPRGIYARTVAFKILFGVIFASFEEVIFHDKEFIKHIPARKRAAFLADKLYGGTTFLVTDYSRFESQFRPWLMQATTGVALEHILEHTPHKDMFMAVFSKVLTGLNLIEFSSIIAIVAGRRMSGEMNTSSSNGLGNSTVMRFAADEHGATFKGVFEGDDGLMSWSGRVPTEEWFARLGLCIVLEVVPSWSTASFCGVIVDVHNLVCITNPIKSIINFGWLSAAKYGAFGKNKCRILYRARALSMLHQYPGCPIIQSFAHMVLRETRDIGDHGVMSLLRKGWGTTQYELNKMRAAIEFFATTPGYGLEPVSMDTRLVMEEAFKVDVQEQIALERAFDEHVKGCPLTLPALEDHPGSAIAALNHTMFVAERWSSPAVVESDWLVRLRTGRRGIF